MRTFSSKNKVTNIKTTFIGQYSEIGYANHSMDFKCMIVIHLEMYEQKFPSH